MIYDDLECLLFEISEPRNTVFLIGTCDRPPIFRPNYSMHELQNVIDKIVAEKKELYLLDAVNCNLLSKANVHVYLFVSSVLNIYGLYELITGPRGVTPVSKKLISLCITHSPEKVTNSRASFTLILVIMLLDSLIVTVMVLARLKCVWGECRFVFLPK